MLDEQAIYDLYTDELEARGWEPFALCVHCGEGWGIHEGGSVSRCLSKKRKAMYYKKTSFLWDWEASERAFWKHYKDDE